VLVTRELKLFTMLADGPLTLDEVCRAKGLKRRPAEALLSVAASLGLVRLVDGRYSLTPVAENIFLRVELPTSADCSI